MLSILRYVTTQEQEHLSSSQLHSLENSQTVAILGEAITPYSDLHTAVFRVNEHTLLIEHTPNTEVGYDLGHQDDGVSEFIKVYVVQRGDTLSEIAEFFRVSVNTIRWHNKLKSSSEIRIGQELEILPITGVRHTVKDSDTLEKIATTYKVTIEAISSFNGLDPEKSLHVGQSLIIPDAYIPQPRAEVRPKVSTSPWGRKVYINRNPTRKITSPHFPGYFKRPIDPKYPFSRGLHGHNAVDIAAPFKEPIMASAGGIVTTARYSGWNHGYGKYVVIAHPNGTKTVYAHMFKVATPAGVLVVQGQIIGYVGSTGNSTGNHLHFEVHNAVNPIIR